MQDWRLRPAGLLRVINAGSKNAFHATLLGEFNIPNLFKHRSVSSYRMFVGVHVAKESQPILATQRVESPGIAGPAYLAAVINSQTRGETQGRWTAVIFHAPGGDGDDEYILSHVGLAHVKAAPSATSSDEYTLSSEGRAELKEQLATYSIDELPASACARSVRSQRAPIDKAAKEKAAAEKAAKVAAEKAAKEKVAAEKAAKVAAEKAHAPCTSSWTVPLSCKCNGTQ